jgi:hypothetical protein
VRDSILNDAVRLARSVGYRETLPSHLWLKTC